MNTQSQDYCHQRRVPNSAASDPEQRLREEEFWERYRIVLQASGVNEGVSVWYQRHCERFIRYVRPKPELSQVREAFAEPLDRLIGALRYRHDSYRTEETYRGWAERYLAHCQGRGLAVPAAGSVRGFLEHLALVGGVAASTQNQALNALVCACG